MADAYNPAAWHDFYLTMAEATMGLTGLSFVIFTLHLSQLRHHRVSVIKRQAAVTPISLLVSFAVAALILFPGQRNSALGAEIAILIVGGLVVLAVLIFWDPETATRDELLDHWAVPRMAFGFIGSLLAFTGAIGLATHSIGGLRCVGIGYLMVVGAAVQGIFEGVYGEEQLVAYVAEITEVLSEQDIRVLYLERRSDQRRRTEKALAQIRSCTVTMFETLEEGIDLAMKDTPDIIFCSAGLVAKSGIDLLSALTTHGVTRDIPVVILDNRPSRKSRKRFLRSGVQAYLGEPVDTHHFYHELGKAIVPHEIARLRL